MMSDTMSTETQDLTALADAVRGLRGDPRVVPDTSIIFPVNAQADLSNVLLALGDIGTYAGKHTAEVLFIVNNFDADCPPHEIETYERCGVVVVAIPDIRRPGEAVALTARIHGLTVAQSSVGILFDADCRIPCSTSLIDWYITQFRAGAAVAYTHVAYYDTEDSVSVRARVFAHHASRWAKRVVLRIPTTRGSNYAVDGPLIVRLYAEGYIADEMNVGPVVKKHGGHVAYSGARDKIVLTSGRYLRGGWRVLARYLNYRIRYNARVLPVRQNVATRTHRKHTKAPPQVNTPVENGAASQSAERSEANVAS